MREFRLLLLETRKSLTIFSFLSEQQKSQKVCRVCVSIRRIDGIKHATLPTMYQTFGYFLRYVCAEGQQRQYSPNGVERISQLGRNRCSEQIFHKQERVLLPRSGSIQRGRRSVRHVVQSIGWVVGSLRR
jgi:hypothetical protein